MFNGLDGGMGLFMSRLPINVRNSYFCVNSRMKHPLLLFWLCTMQLSFAQGHTLTVKISGIQGKGTVYVQLFEEGEKFRADAEGCREESVFLENGPGQVSFSDVDEGSYAVMIYHDENNNGILDTNMIGMPKEGVGTSNNVKGIPSFKKCRFRVDDSSTIDIELVYF